MLKAAQPKHCPNFHQSATTLQPLMDEANDIDRLTTVQCPIGNPGSCHSCGHHSTQTFLPNILATSLNNGCAPALKTEFLTDDAAFSSQLMKIFGRKVSWNVCVKILKDWAPYFWTPKLLLISFRWWEQCGSILHWCYEIVAPSPVDSNEPRAGCWVVLMTMALHTCSTYTLHLCMCTHQT